MPTFDPSADLAQVADNVETVTLLRRGIVSEQSGTVVHNALRRAVEASEFAARNRSEIRRYINSDGRCIAADVDWHLPAAQLDKPPRIGDAILDADGRRWTIMELDLVMLRTRWKCFCRELAIAHGLDDRVAVLKAEFPPGGGDPVWQTWRTGVRARIQPVEVKVSVVDSVRSSTATFHIFLEEDLALDHTHRIRAADGSLFEITSVTGAARLGELQTVEAVKI
jgi:hypothetical protein